jgi:phospholipase/carboxylesterase
MAARSSSRKIPALSHADAWFGDRGAREMAVPEAIIIQQPTGAAAQLVLLFHGVGADAVDMAPLGRRLAKEFPQALVVSLPAPGASDMGAGGQWFPLQGITDENRPDRVEAAMPAFLATIRHWQKVSAVDREGTALVGFSQGAIMALESTRDREALAGRVIAIGGRFARLPEEATGGTTVHLFHGKADPVVSYAHTIAAAERLLALGGDVTADVLPFVGHEINEEVLDLLVERLKGYIPRRRWEEALRDAPGAGGPMH